MKPATTEGAQVFLTGATGFLGKVVLEELVRRRDELEIGAVHVLVREKLHKRATDPSVPQQRFEQEIASSACFSRLPADWSEMVHVVEGELTRPGMDLDPVVSRELAASVTHIINCAASVEFDAPLAEAANMNVTSALNVLEFARTCSQLERMVNVSTAYVTPHVSDDTEVPEAVVDLDLGDSDPESVYASIVAGEADTDALLERAHLPNTYTFTKCLAEALQIERMGDVPLAIVRPSIISAAWKYPFSGWIDSSSAFAGFVLLAAAGYMRAINGKPETALDIIPVDAVAQSVIDTAFADSVQLISHAAAGIDRCSRVDECATVVTSYFRRHPLARGPNIVYVGDDERKFRRKERRHSTRPVKLAARWSRLRRNKVQERRANKLLGRLEYINEAFPYFTTHTFRFACAQPPELDGFDNKQYIECVSAGVNAHLLAQNPRQATLAGKNRQGKGDLAWARSQPQGNWAHRISAPIVAKGLRKASREITFDRPSFERARELIDPDGLVVLTPTHRSYMDFVLCSYLPFAHPDLGIPIPHVAAAREFSHIPALGWLLEKNQAFYIERNLGRADPELIAKVRDLADRRQTLEFFVEGTRSRSRQFLPPKRGLLRTLQSTGVPCTILPIAISYDHVPEERAFVKELEGGPKPPMKLRALLGWSAKLFADKIDIGRVHMVCGTPLQMTAETDIVELSGRISGELQDATVTSTHHLRAFVHANPNAGLDVEWLSTAIGARGGVVIDSHLETYADVEPVIERGMRYHWLHLFYPEARALYADHPAVAHHIELNGYATARARDALVPTDPRVVGLLDAIFAPVGNDYARVAASLAHRPGVDDDDPAKALVSEHPGSFLPEVEGVLKDLLAREMLADPEADSGLRLDAPAADLHAYAKSCGVPDHVVDLAFERAGEDLA